ncbi:MAG: hypothetical protein OXQ90_15205 [Gammaproteobacteria bacterium]|nr:hypothetical protein [Gammaproteobacteria bacterium]
MLVLDINDAEITLRRNGEVLYREPGVANVAPKTTLLGAEARARSRLHPQQSHNEFWQRLNADPVMPHGRGVANQADLVYLQLRELRAATGEKRPAVVVAAPSAVTNEQFAVLLGISAEAGLDVRAIVDASVAAASREAWDGSCGVVDVSLQRATVARVERVDAGDGPIMRRAAVDEVPAAGLVPLLEGWIDVVADRFVDGTRFDPLRIATTEQQVFDQLLAGIDTGAAEFAIEVDHQDVTRRVSVSRHALAQKSTQRYELFARALGGPGTLAVSHRVLRLPGFAGFLQEAGHQLLPLPPDAIDVAVRDQVERILPGPEDVGSTPGARLVTSLPALAGTASPDTPSKRPTHVLCNALAIPLVGDLSANEHPAFRPGSPNFRVRCGENGVSVVPAPDTAISLNGMPIDFEHPAAVGDTIDSGNLAFHLIAVVDGVTDG